MNSTSSIHKRINLFKRKLTQIIYATQYSFENASNLVACIVRTRYRTGNNAYSNIFLLAKESHSNVVPQWWALRGCHSSYSVLVQGHIKVSMSLHHAPSRHDGLDMRGVIGHGISKVFKCSLVLTNLKSIISYG